MAKTGTDQDLDCGGTLDVGADCHEAMSRRSRAVRWRCPGEATRPESTVRPGILRARVRIAEAPRASASADRARSGRRHLSAGPSCRAQTKTAIGSTRSMSSHHDHCSLGVSLRTRSPAHASRDLRSRRPSDAPGRRGLVASERPGRRGSDPLLASTEFPHRLRRQAWMKRDHGSPRPEVHGWVRRVVGGRATPVGVTRRRERGRIAGRWGVRVRSTPRGIRRRSGWRDAAGAARRGPLRPRHPLPPLPYRDWRVPPRASCSDESKLPGGFNGVSPRRRGSLEEPRPRRLNPEASMGPRPERRGSAEAQDQLIIASCGLQWGLAPRGEEAGGRPRRRSR